MTRHKMLSRKGVYLSLVLEKTFHICFVELCFCDSKGCRCYILCFCAFDVDVQHKIILLFVHVV